MARRREGETEMNPKPKKPARNRKYLNWIREKACYKCGITPAGDPHHEAIYRGQKGLNVKVSDYLAIPLCRICHTKRHAHKFSEFWIEKFSWLETQEIVWILELRMYRWVKEYAKEKRAHARGVSGAITSMP